MGLAQSLVNLNHGEQGDYRYTIEIIFTETKNEPVIYENVILMGQAVDDDDCLYMFKEGFPTDVPSVIVNMRNVMSVSVVKMDPIIKSSSEEETEEEVTITTNESKRTH